MNIQKGQTHFGKVVRIADFGVFVKLNCKDTGLIHYSQLRGNSRGLQDQRLKTIIIGQEVAVDVLDVREAGKKRLIDLSERAVFEDLILAQLPLLEELVGSITHLTNFGAFIFLPDWSVSALLHVSDMMGDNRTQRDKRLASLKVGDQLTIFATSVAREGADLNVRCSETAPDGPFEIICHGKDEDGHETILCL